MIMKRVNFPFLAALVVGCVSCTHSTSVREGFATYEGTTEHSRLSVRDDGRSLEIRPGADGATLIVHTLNDANYRCALVAGIAVCAVLSSDVDGVVPTSDGGTILTRLLPDGNSVFVVKYETSTEQSCDYTV